MIAEEMNATESSCHDPKWDQSLGEELANGVSHGLGLLAAPIGGPVLLVATGDRLISSGIYSCSLARAAISSPLSPAFPHEDFA